jgi:TPR repeat protein
MSEPFCCRPVPNPDRVGHLSNPQQLKWLVAVFVAVVVASPALAGPYEDALDAISRSDYAMALTFLRPLAEQGNAPAATQLGIMYLNGRGVAQDYGEALKWFGLAAKQGDGNAEYNLGVMNVDGQGVPQDYAQAVKWYQLAAGQGLVQAEGNLGYMYATGEGTPRDYVLAYMWFTLAAGQGDDTAVDNRNNAAVGMTAAQISEAAQLARRWKPTKQP